MSNEHDGNEYTGEAGDADEDMAFEENRKKRSIATEHAVKATTDGMRGEAASSDAN